MGSSRFKPWSNKERYIPLLCSIPHCGAALPIQVSTSQLWMEGTLSRWDGGTEMHAYPAAHLTIRATVLTVVHPGAWPWQLMGCHKRTMAGRRAFSQGCLGGCFREWLASDMGCLKSYPRREVTIDQALGVCLAQSHQEGLTSLDE